jgi:hypothetical protein
MYWRRLSVSSFLFLALIELKVDQKELTVPLIWIIVACEPPFPVFLMQLLGGLKDRFLNSQNSKGYPIKRVCSSPLPESCSPETEAHLASSSYITAPPPDLESHTRVFRRSARRRKGHQVRSRGGRPSFR